jgi:hypothetical protein
LGGTGIGDGDFIAGEAYEIDRIAPTAALSSTAPARTNTAPIPVTVTFSEDVTGFTASDIIARNATVGDFAGGGATYTFTLAPIADGLVTAGVATNLAQDLAGNANTAAPELTRVYDTTAPAVFISSVTTNATNISPIPVVVTFNENVMDFIAAEIVVTNGTVDNFMGSGAEYTFDLLPSANGRVIVNISAGVAVDLVGYDNTAAPQFIRIYDTVAPVVNTFAAQALVTNLNIPITAFGAADNFDIAGYKITTSAAQPEPGAAGWTAARPKKYRVSASGNYDLYPWVKDAAGNVSAVFASPANVSVVPAIYRSAAARDGWTLESSEFSNVAATKSDKGFLRVGDDARNKQYRSILSFDTSRLPDTAVIAKATLLVKKFGMTGDVSLLGDFVADLKRGSFGRAPLESGDFKSTSSTTAAGKLRLVTGDWYQLSLNPLYFKHIHLTGSTQFRLRFAKDDNNNRQMDFLAFFAGNADMGNQPQLVIEYYVP